MNNKRKVLSSIALFGVLVAVYFLTYLSHEASTDELILFDAGHSVYQNGLLELRYTNDIRPYPVRDVSQVVDELDSEPLHAYAASMMIWLAAHLPGIGLMQAAWTLNIFATALTAVVLFFYSPALCFRGGTPLGGSLGYSLATFLGGFRPLFFLWAVFSFMFFFCF